MVMFTCNRCSKGLKKKDVLNHSFQCGGRSNINVACIDCLKDFRGDEYNSHTSCVSEEVRYGGKGVVAKECGKKQNQWLGIVRQVLSVNESLDKPVRKFLQSVQHLENIPRQKRKFHNWANSAMHIKDTSFLDHVFDILHEEFTKNKSNDSPKNTTDDAVDEQNEETSTNGEGQQKKKKSKKRDEIVEEAHSEENGLNGFEKKKKIRSQEEEEPVETEATEPDSTVPETSEEGSKLSKKERKLKKKKAKFEAELQEIENVQNEDDAGEGVVEEEPPKTKKSKKRKLVDENDVDKDDDDGKDGKRKKVDEDRVNGNSNEKLSSEAAASPHVKHKFNWHQMIIDVLKSSKRDEMRVKKVSKIVINEYFSLYGDIGIHEKLGAKMNKKLRTCPGIRVLKDKVKLLEAEE